MDWSFSCARYENHCRNVLILYLVALWNLFSRRFGIIKEGFLGGVRKWIPLTLEPYCFNKSTKPYLDLFLLGRPDTLPPHQNSRLMKPALAARLTDTFLYNTFFLLTHFITSKNINCVLFQNSFACAGQAILLKTKQVLIVNSTGIKDKIILDDAV